MQKYKKILVNIFYFVTHSCQYDFLYMPVGLSDYSLMFLSYIYDGFGDLTNAKVFITYMDVFLTPAENEDGIEF